MTNLHAFTIITFFSLALCHSVGIAWSYLASRCRVKQRQRPISWTGHSCEVSTKLHSTTRRDYLAESVTVSSFTSLSAASVILGVVHPVANAAASSDANIFVDRRFSLDDAVKRFQAAQKDLHYLKENYSEISKGGGDSVRNRLGTQGVNSNLYGIQKVLKVLQEQAIDIVAYTEAMDEFNAYYYQADGAAYQSLFVEHSSAKGTPESFLKIAEHDIDQMETFMNHLAAQLGI